MSPTNAPELADSIDVQGVLYSVLNREDPNEDDIYLGISGADLLVDKFDFGAGITIKSTYAHVFAPYLVAFNRPAKQGDPHPAPWKTVSGGLAFDITHELHVPLDFNTERWFDRLNTAWWLVFLLRLKSTPFLLAPIASNFSFSQIGKLNLDARFFPIEFDVRRTLLPRTLHRQTAVEELNWVRSSWLHAGKLMRESDSFAHACLVLDRSIHENDLSLALVTVWGALERLFADFKSELSYRIAMNISSYLAPHGKQRFVLFKSVKKLYDARSKAAHGRPNETSDVFIQSFNILRSAILEMISQNHVPTPDEIDQLVLGADGDGPQAG